MLFLYITVLASFVIAALAMIIGWVYSLFNLYLFGSIILLYGVITYNLYKEEYNDIYNQHK